jgi:hypothetical protein
MRELEGENTETCREVVELGLIIFGLIADAGEGRSIMMYAGGKKWKLTLEQIIDEVRKIDLPIWMLFSTLTFS